MSVEKAPFYKRILLWLLLPVLAVGLTCSTLLVARMTSPIETYLARQFDANLRLASTMSLRTCEESFNYLLDLRLEKDTEMNKTLKTEALKEIHAISDHFPQIHLMVIESNTILRAYSAQAPPAKWEGPTLDGRDDEALMFDFDGETILSHIQFFPFWDWHIVSFVREQDYQTPIRMAYLSTYTSALGVFLAVLITLLIVFHLFIKTPLNRLISATERVAEGHLSKIPKITHNEFGRLMVSFNSMVDSLKQQKETLQQRFLQLKSLYNNLPIVVWSIDKDGTFTLSEGKELPTLGLQPGQLVGTSIFDLYKDHPATIGKNQRGLCGEFCDYETEVMENTYHTVIMPVLDENETVQGVNGLAINITEKKKADEELLRLRNYLSNIIDSMPSALIGVDSQGVVTQWNSEAQRITGVAADTALGRPFTRAFPRLRAEMDHIHEAIDKQKVCSTSRQKRSEQGEVRYEDVTIYPLVANGVEGAVIRVDDVTEKVRLEEMMVQSAKILSVGGLAAGMAHEINNPMAAMMQTANVMSNRLGQNLSIPANRKAAEAAGTTLEAIAQFMETREIPRMLAAITESGRRVASIVDNMLSFARKSEAAVTSHSLEMLLDKSLELAATDYDLKKQYDFKRIVIEKQYASDLPSIPCEASKIQQVVLNIIKNGAEAMQEAGTENPRFILRLWLDDVRSRVCMAIEDNGPGMDQDTCNHIFEPFFTTKPAGIGTGLGLSVSYFIITENHQGELTVDSEPGTGTTFTICLPVHGVQHQTGQASPAYKDREMLLPHEQRS